MVLDYDLRFCTEVTVGIISLRNNTCSSFRKKDKMTLLIYIQLFPVVDTTSPLWL